MMGLQGGRPVSNNNLVVIIVVVIVLLVALAFLGVIPGL
jgi:hypothetical protein